MTAASLKLLATAYLPNQLIRLPGPPVLFLGRSNVGKSSLLNALTGQGMAKVSKSPGKTRSINYYLYQKKTVLIDVPGYGYAKRSHQERDAWADLMRVFFDGLDAGALFYILMDSKRDLAVEEWRLVEALQDQGHFLHVLMTKADRLNQSERHARQRDLQQSLGKSGLPWQWVSAKSREGIVELQRQIEEYSAA